MNCTNTHYKFLPIFILPAVVVVTQVTKWDDHRHLCINLIQHPSEFPERLNSCSHFFKSSGVPHSAFTNLKQTRRPAQPTRVSIRHHLIYMSRPTTVCRYCGVKMWGNIPGTTYRVEDFGHMRY